MSCELCSLKRVIDKCACEHCEECNQWFSAGQVKNFRCAACSTCEVCGHQSDSVALIDGQHLCPEHVYEVAL